MTSRKEERDKRRRRMLPFVILLILLLLGSLVFVGVFAYRQSTANQKVVNFKILGGSSQSTIVGQPFGQRFTVRVIDAATNQPVRGLTVGFSVAGRELPPKQSPQGTSIQPTRAVLMDVVRGSGTSYLDEGAPPSGTFASCPIWGSTNATCFVSTDRKGLATSSQFTANRIPGEYNVTATIEYKGHVYTVTFHLFNAPIPGGAGGGPDQTGNRSQFSISGNVDVPLSPNVNGPIDLAISNPFFKKITVPSGGITISIESLTPSCSAAENFAVLQGLGASLTIPARSSRSLSELKVPMKYWPVIGMLETHTNQDACKNTQLVLHYTGMATG